MTPQAVRVHLTGEDGNVFAIIGRVSAALQAAGFEAEARAYVKAAWACHSYDAVLQLDAAHGGRAMKPAVAALLAGCLLGGCSLLGLYGAPVLGPPSETGGAPTYTLYNSSGARVGTVVPSGAGRGR